jgi:hypothetical protein
VLVPISVVQDHSFLLRLGHSLGSNGTGVWRGCLLRGERSCNLERIEQVTRVTVADCLRMLVSLGLCTTFRLQTLKLWGFGRHMAH